jgi:hypothetical protein
MLTAVILAVPLLGPSPMPPWGIPTCPPHEKQWIGGALAIARPKGARIETVRDVDYVCRRATLPSGESLRACEGPHWTSGRPGPHLTDGARDLVEKRIEWPGMPSDWSWDYGPVDVRGTAPDGTKWRYIGIFGASIEYTDIREHAAPALDVILDRLCWRGDGRK